MVEYYNSLEEIQEKAKRGSIAVLRGEPNEVYVWDYDSSWIKDVTLERYYS